MKVSVLSVNCSISFARNTNSLFMGFGLIGHDGGNNNILMEERMLDNNQIKKLQVTEYQGVELEIIDHNGTPWLKGPQIGGALGYKSRHGNAVSKIYDRNKDEFTPEMTTVIDLPQIGGGVVPTRIFSPRGCWLLGMFARTDKAKDFRRWVLDVLEGHAQVQRMPHYPTLLQQALL
ncbi:MAG: Bro-N domain-containing protein, partial [bacterium]